MVRKFMFLALILLSTPAFAADFEWTGLKLLTHSGSKKDITVKFWKQDDDTIVTRHYTFDELVAEAGKNTDNRDWIGYITEAYVNETE